MSQSSQGGSGQIRRVSEPKVFNDPIHGHIEVEAVYMHIIDTPEFQRLRNLKQLGAVNFVYPGAVHTRFEHSIGTCYLARRLIRHLKETQHNLGITKEEELCVGLAALCHDLGHGPFSHLFDRIFIPKFKPDKYENWSHELGSIKIFDQMVERYELKDRFEEYGYKLDNTDFHFVKEMIYGPLDMNSADYVKPKDGKYQAKFPDKHFFYEIVSNKTNEIDVDKWDYFARDSYHLGVPCSFTHNRFIKFAKVLNVEKGQKKTQICFRDKEAPSVYEMFHTRFRLYMMSCYHPVAIGVEAMITDALVAAGKHLKLTKPGGKTFTMAEAITDMDAYRLLDDNILTLIRHSYGNRDLAEARGILERMQKRQLYKMVRQITVPLEANKHDLNEDVIRDNIIACKANDGSLSANDICVKAVNRDYGMKDKNPVDSVLFFSKDKPNQPKPISKEEVSHILPHTFQERLLLVYVKNIAKRSLAGRCIDEWRAKTHWLQKASTAEDGESEKTPVRDGKVQAPPNRPLKRASARGDDHEVEAVTKKLFTDTD